MSSQRLDSSGLESLTYLPLDGPILQQYQGLLLTEGFEMVRVLGQTTFEKGIEKGEELGVLKGRRAQMRRLLEKRFGPLPPSALQSLESCSDERLQRLEDDFLAGKPLAELALDPPNGAA